MPLPMRSTKRAPKTDATEVATGKIGFVTALSP
jgi:hypothetical protein